MKVHHAVWSERFRDYAPRCETQGEVQTSDLSKVTCQECLDGGKAAEVIAHTKRMNRAG